MNNINHTAATARLNDLEQQLNGLFVACEKECEGLTITASNKIFAEKYKTEYDRLDRQIDIVARVFWYTNPVISRHNKQINHRATVADMRAAGLHVMSI